jgi:hypothetical protein
MLDQTKVSKDLEKRGTIDLMEQASKDQYTPPADGRLTDAQVQMYLKVREREKQIVEVAKKEMQQHAEKVKKEEAEKDPFSAAMASMKTLGSAADLATADIRAAVDLGLNTAEYSWVKQQILEASGAAVSQQVAAATSKLADGAYTQMKQQYEQAKDETTRKMLGDMLKQYEDQRAQMAVPAAETNPTIEYNQQLLAKYGSAINPLAQEWAKYETTPGQSQESMEKGLQELQKAAAEMPQQPTAAK